MTNTTRIITIVFILLAFLLPEAAQAANSDITLITTQTGANGEESFSVSLQILFFMTLLSLLPAVLMSVTSFTRIVVLLGLALFTTLFIMAPVFEDAYNLGVKPYMEEQVDFDTAMVETKGPFHKFMASQTRESDLALFSELGGYDGFASVEEVPFKVLVPAYITSELKTAFQIGFLIFIPFLVIDLVVASILMSMGMMMLSPMLISLPFKLMLFVMVDGWTLVMGTLAASFYG